jgi:hypothetical protein
MTAKNRLAATGLAAVLLAGLAAPAGAQAPAAPAAPAAAPAPAANITEASRREARALGDKLGWESQVRGIINTLRTAIIVNLAQTNGKQPQEMISVVDDVLMPDFVGDAAGLHTLIVDAWAGAFTADELRNLRSFYSTPLGDKLLRTLPQLNSAVNLAGQGWAQKIFQAAQTKHAEEFTKRGLKFAP